MAELPHVDPEALADRLTVMARNFDGDDRPEQRDDLRAAAAALRSIPTRDVAMDWLLAAWMTPGVGVSFRDLVNASGRDFDEVCAEWAAFRAPTPDPTRGVEHEGCNYLGVAVPGGWWCNKCGSGSPHNPRLCGCCNDLACTRCHPVTPDPEATDGD